MQKKPRPPAQVHVKPSHEIIAEALIKVGGAETSGAQLKAHAEVARKIGISKSMLYKWRQPALAGSGSANPLDRTVALMAATQDVHIIQWLAQKAGGTFVSEETPTATQELAKASNSLIKEFGLLIAEVVSAAEDQRISPDESQRLRNKWNGLRQKTETFVRACEKGDYSSPA